MSTITLGYISTVLQKQIMATILQLTPMLPSYQREMALGLIIRWVTQTLIMRKLWKCSITNNMIISFRIIINRPIAVGPKTNSTHLIDNRKIYSKKGEASKVLEVKLCLSVMEKPIFLHKDDQVLWLWALLYQAKITEGILDNHQAFFNR